MMMIMSKRLLLRQGVSIVAALAVAVTIVVVVVVVVRRKREELLRLLNHYRYLHQVQVVLVRQVVQVRRNRRRIKQVVRLPRKLVSYFLFLFCYFFKWRSFFFACSPEMCCFFPHSLWLPQPAALSLSLFLNAFSLQELWSKKKKDWVEMLMPKRRAAVAATAKMVTVCVYIYTYISVVVDKKR